MKKIFLEIYSKYIEGKNNLKVLGNIFESVDIDELIHILTYFDNIEINTNKELIEFNGQLINLNLSVIDKKRLQNKWSRLIIQDEIERQKTDDFFEMNKELIYQKLEKDLKLNEEEIEAEIEEEVEKIILDEPLNEIKEPKDFYLKIIGKKINNILPNIKIYDTSENIVFWNISKDLKLDKQKIIELLNIFSIINIKKYNFSFSILPLYDFENIENENATGINIILNIFY